MTYFFKYKLFKFFLLFIGILLILLFDLNIIFKCVQSQLKK